MSSEPGGPAMTSNRPYLLRALYQWIVDNGLTPHVLVDANDPDAQVPAEHVREGRIILNVSPQAVPDLFIDDAWMTFSARFGGRARNIRVPVRAVLAVYARENGRGMVLPREEAGDGEAPDPGGNKPAGGDGRPALRVVK